MPKSKGTMLVATKVMEHPVIHHFDALITMVRLRRLESAEIFSVL